MARKVKNSKERVIKEETTFGDEIEHSLDDFFGALDRGESVTVRDIKLDLRPAQYSAEDVKAVRAKLKVSQAGLAQVLAVDVKTVQAWEQGKISPSGPASRLLDDINQDPKGWLAGLKHSLQSRASKRPMGRKECEA